MANNYRDFRFYYLLNLINHFDQISRTELASLTDYRAGTVGETVKEMIEKSFVIEKGLHSVGHGRSRTLLHINHERLCSIGIAISRTHKKVIVAIVQSNGIALDQITTSIREDNAHDSIINVTVNATKELISRFSDRIIIGIGIARPSYNPILHESESLELNFEHYNDWIDYEMKSRLEEATKIDTYTFSSIGLPGTAEYHYGKTKYSQFMIIIELSNGIGSSIIINGSPVIGSNERAGHIGHTVIDFSGAENKICSCGKVGCVEATSAWPAVKENIMSAIEKGSYSYLLPIIKSKGDILTEDVHRCLDRGDQLCRHFVKEAAIRIGIAVANEINILNPEIVIFHGFMLELGDYFTDQVKNSIRDNTLSLSQNYEIEFLETSESKFVLGAAAAVFSSFLRFDEFKWVYQLEDEIISE